MACALLAVALAMAVSGVAAAKGATFFTLTNGTLHTVDVINGQGDVAGTWTDSKGKFAAYLLLANGSVTTFEIPGVRQVTGIDENDDLIGSYQLPNAKAWFYVQGQVLTVHVNPKGESVQSVELTSMNTTQGEVVGWYLDSKDRAHSFTVSYPTVSQGPKISFFDCQFDNGTKAQSTLAVSGDSSGDIAGTWADEATLHGFFRRAGANCVSFDPPGSTSTTVTGLDDWDDMIGSSVAADSSQSGFVLYGDTLIDGSKKPSFATLGADVSPSFLVTQMNQQTGGTSDFILGFSNGQPTSFTAARNSNETFGRVKSSAISLGRCAPQTIVFAGVASFANEIAGYCIDSSSQQPVGFLMPLN